MTTPARQTGTPRELGVAEDEADDHHRDHAGRDHRPDGTTLGQAAVPPEVVAGDDQADSDGPQGQR